MDRDREVFALLRLIRNHKGTYVARKSGISASTVYKWRRPVAYGGTKYPRFHTMRQVATAFGHRWELVKK